MEEVKPLSFNQQIQSNSRRLWFTLPMLLMFTTTSAGLTGATEKVRYTLNQLIAFAQKNYPGVKAAEQAVVAMEAKLYQANWAWLPQGTAKGFMTLSPEIKCLDGVEKCSQTNNRLDVTDYRVAGVYGRIDIEVGMPIYTFDKIGAAKRAATAGVEVTKAQVKVSKDTVERDVAKAFWGVKLAREILYTIDEGKEYLNKAQKRIEKDLDEGEGDATLVDLLRLKTFSAEIDSRTFEAKKLETLALASLTTLTGQKSDSWDVDAKVIAPLEAEVKPLEAYLRTGHQNRPEIKLLNAAMQARQAAVDLEKARFFPDFLLVGSFGYAAAPTDDPENAFFNDPFNYFGAGFGIAMRWKWDQVQQYGKYKVARAEASQDMAKREEALAGIDLEIKKTWVELNEASDRLTAAEKGSKAARKWLVATSQNLAAGLCEPKELTDALLAFFQLKLKHLQAVFDLNVGWQELKRVVGSSNL